MTVDKRFQEQAQTFITETLKSEIPDANVDAGSALNALLARGGSAVAAALMQETDHVLTTRDLTDPDSMPEADVDRILENLLVERDGGESSYGFVRLYYQTRKDRVFPAGTIAQNESGQLNYVTLADLTFATDAYYLDADSGLYYVNVPFVAEAAGTEYDAEPGDITKLANVSEQPVRVTNVSAFRGGAERQTNSQAVRKATLSVSTRTPVSSDGTVYFLQEKFKSKLVDALIVGNGDDEMTRDEVYDMGETQTPRFAIGRDAIGGTAMGVHVGGRTDVYTMWSGVNYVQQVVDVFADMTLDALTPAGVSAITATIVTGATGTVSPTGKLIIEIGDAGEETLFYTSRSQLDADTFLFTLEATTSFDHDAGVSVKAVNNETIDIAPDGDVTTLPVLLIADVTLLDPITLEPVGQALPETTAASRTPGWYVADVSEFDVMSARERKSLVVSEKRDAAGNQPLSATGGDTTTVSVGGVSFTKYTNAGVDFTGYQGREITLSGTFGDAERVVLQVLSATEIYVEKNDGVIDITPEAGVSFDIAAGYADYNQYPVRVSYYTNTEIEEVQDLFDNDKKRSITSDTLSRAFMPVTIDFTFAYRGEGTVIDVREAIQNVLKTSSGEPIGENVGAKFDYSDLINAAYDRGLANYVLTPFEVKVTKYEFDGTRTVSWLNPGPNTVNEMAVDEVASAGSTFVVARIPDVIDAFTVPDNGKLYLGGFGNNRETVEYASVFKSGDKYTFVLSDGYQLAYGHAVDEGLKVSVADYDPANVIVDGVIVSERAWRPYLGNNVVIENLDS